MRDEMAGQRLVEVPLSAKCDRCGHLLREHASAVLGTICMVGRSKADQRARRYLCPCDGFFQEH